MSRQDHSDNPYRLMPGGAEPSAPPAQTYQAAPQPAYDLSALLDSSPQLETDLRAADQQLKAYDMQSVRARVILAIDISASMGPGQNKFITDDANCPLQLLINKAIALALLFDDDGEVTVYPFGDKAYDSFTINKDNYQQAVASAVRQAGGLKDGTNYNAVVRRIQAELLGNDELCYERGKVTKPQSTREEPVFCLFATDGEHNREQGAAIEALTQSTGQAIFWKFMGLGSENAEAFKFLSSFDNHEDVFKEGCFMDNCNLVVVRSPQDLTMEMLLQEFRGWLVDAHEEGILLTKPAVPEHYHNKEGRIDNDHEAKSGWCCSMM